MALLLTLFSFQQTIPILRTVHDVELKSLILLLMEASERYDNTTLGTNLILLNGDLSANVHYTRYPYLVAC